MTNESIIAARRSAEAAVEDMQDGALKTAAFQTILTQLLHRVSIIGSGTHNFEETSRTSSKKQKSSKPSTGTTGRLITLIEEGVFSQQRSLSEIRQTLSNKGWHYRVEDLGTPLTRLVRRKRLRRVQVAEGKKKIWKYSEY